MNFIAIDFETANQRHESAISIGLVKFVDGKKADSFYSLIKPEKELDEEYFFPAFIDIHGLTCDDVKDAPLFNELWDSDLKHWLDGSLPLVAHNANVFDMKVLNALFEKYSIEHTPIKYFDSLLIARQVWPHFESHRLTALGEEFGIEYDAHNALADSETCGKIILLAAQEKHCKNVNELLMSCGQVMRLENKKLDKLAMPLSPKRIEKVIGLIENVWHSGVYQEMRFFQFVEVLKNEYKHENGECDFWNLHDEEFAAWLEKKIK